MKFIANIWPVAVADGYTDTILNELKKESSILSIHKIMLNYTGLRNYMVQIYRHEKWAGHYFNHFRGIPAKLAPCFYPDTPMYLVELEGSSVESMLACKERIRAVCKHEKHSLHTSDTPEEYLLMKKILLHPPTVSLMNTAAFDNCRSFMRSFFRFINLLNQYNLDADDFLIVSKAVYALTGIQKEKQISWIQKNTGITPCRLNKLNKNEFLSVYEQYEDIILNPDNHISYCGIDFLHPDVIKKLEQTR